MQNWLHSNAKVVLGWIRGITIHIHCIAELGECTVADWITELDTEYTGFLQKSQCSCAVIIYQLEIIIVNNCKHYQ